jgi:hypothetical protein
MVSQQTVKFMDGKGKIHSRTGYEGPHGAQTYGFALSLTSALDADERSTPRPGRFTPGNAPGPILWEAWWTPERFGRVRKIFV